MIDTGDKERSDRAVSVEKYLLNATLETVEYLGENLRERLAMTPPWGVVGLIILFFAVIIVRILVLLDQVVRLGAVVAAALASMRVSCKTDVRFYFGDKR